MTRNTKLHLYFLMSAGLSSFGAYCLYIYFTFDRIFENTEIIICVDRGFLISTPVPSALFILAGAIFGKKWWKLLSQEAS